MHTVPIEQAPSQITQLLAEVMSGEEVVFTRELKPVVRLSSIPESNGISDAAWAERFRASIGMLKGMDTSNIREKTDMLQAVEAMKALKGSLKGMDSHIPRSERE